MEKDFVTGMWLIGVGLAAGFGYLFGRTANDGLLGDMAQASGVVAVMLLLIGTVLALCPYEE